MMTAQTPKASVVVCTYDRLRIADLEACVASLLGQQYDDFEILVTVDHNKALYDTLARKFEHSKVKVVPNDSKKRGQASTMNCGLRNSHGEIVCFIDDDAIASKEWLWTLVSGYDRSTLGVGGRIEALWLGKKPNYLPEEFYWLVGATGNYLPSKPMKTRNLWSCNASYKRTLLNELGGFSEAFGGHLGGLLFQGECTEFGLRISKITGKAPRYVPTAIVYHKIRGDRLRLAWLLGRAYRQGYAKAYIQRLHSSRYALSVEYGFLDSLVKSNLRRLGRVIHGPEKRYALEQFGFSLSSTAAVLIGFVIGLATIRISHQDRVKIANRTTNTPPDHTHEASPRS